MSANCQAFGIANLYGNPAPFKRAYGHRNSNRPEEAEKLWTEGERVAFISWIAANPLTGDVIPGAGGARKVRWSRAGSGKSGGARVIDFNLT